MHLPFFLTVSSKHVVVILKEKIDFIHLLAEM